jgi:Arc/MetJ-type ribon-helix-helix transcriptional regulator
MGTAENAISLDPETLRKVDQLAEQGAFPSRSQFIQDAVAEKLQRLSRRGRLAQECAKLQPSEERAAAEEFFQGESEGSEY